MATYKLLQDIEAEDHILGPLTLRQFIFALVTVFFIYLSFLSITKSFPFMLVIFAPVALFCFFFALPLGRDQPTEIWALAKLRFWFKPRVRVWNQSGVKDLVTINVPKKIEPVLTNGLSQIEVKSRLKALASTIDTRGWAIKNVSTYGPPAAMASNDRLIDIGSLPRAVPADETRTDDVLDNTSSPIARQFDDMITESTQSHRQELMARLNDIRETRTDTGAGAGVSDEKDSWFMMKPHAGSALTPVAVGTQAALPVVRDDAGLARQLKQRNDRPVPYGNLRTMQPLAPVTDDVGAAATVDNTSVSRPVTAPGDPAILSLANNNDLNVATLAREAEKAKQEGRPQPKNEVVISLH